MTWILPGFARSLLLVLVVGGVSVFGVHSAYATDIWFAASEPVWRTIRHWPENDWIALFARNAPWPRAATNTRVFELSKRAVLEMSQPDLTGVLTSLRQHHIRLSVQGTPLLATQVCGLGIEGHGPSDDMVQVATRLKLFGADLAYVTMDEPLWYGHIYNGQDKQKPCHNTIQEIARQTAVKMKAVRRIYPNVIIGDDEPIGVSPALADEWITDIQTWLDAYKDAMGEPLGFFHADVIWQQSTWPAVLQPVIRIVRQRHITLGIIYNGFPTDSTDADWINSATAHFQQVEGRMGIRPDHAIIQSWMDRPRAMLPEDNPGALTNLILRYSAWLSGRS